MPRGEPISELVRELIEQQMADRPGNGLSAKKIADSFRLSVRRVFEIHAAARKRRAAGPGPNSSSC